MSSLCLNTESTKEEARREESTTELTMVGYAPNGYRLWDLGERRIVIARDVMFKENFFPSVNDARDYAEERPLIYEEEGEEIQWKLSVRP